MTFGKAIKSGFLNYATFKGRASRSEYWFWALFLVIASISITILEAAAGIYNVAVIFYLATFLPGISVLVRRLHDVNRAGWWYWLVLTGVGAFVLLYWLTKKSDDGENSYGLPTVSKIVGNDLENQREKNTSEKQQPTFGESVSEVQGQEDFSKVKTPENAIALDQNELENLPPNPELDVEDVSENDGQNDPLGSAPDNQDIEPKPKFSLDYRVKSDEDIDDLHFAQKFQDLDQVFVIFKTLGLNITECTEGYKITDKDNLEYLLGTKKDVFDLAKQIAWEANLHSKGKPV
jgi:uncharacterized membrane protein YhaH (DUF805 family)